MSIQTTHSLSDVTVPAIGHPPARTPGVISLWDGPNMLTTLRGLTGTDSKVRFDFTQLARWIQTLAGPGDHIESVVFINVPSTQPSTLASFVHAVRKSGSAVFAKPKNGASDVDDDIVAMANASSVDTVILATHDKALIDRVAHASSGAALTVLGIREESRCARTRDDLVFIDVGDVSGLVTGPIPRQARLDDLPPAGLLLPALTTLLGRQPTSATAP